MQTVVESKKRFLLICNDVLGLRMAGPAIRYVEMARALATNYEVTLVAPAIDENLLLPGLTLLPDVSDVVVAQAIKADFVIFQGDALVKYPRLKGIKGVLIADLYCPILLEYHQSSSGVASEIRTLRTVFLARVMTEQLSFADHFICASEKQRDFWLGGLAMLGRINGQRWPEAIHANLDDLISLVPFGLPDQPPEKDGPGLRGCFGIPENEFVAVWGGGIYQWFDPLTPIRAIHRLVTEGYRVHLVFMGVKHPNPDIDAHDRCAEAVELANTLGLTDHFVHFNFGWVDYDRRQNFFLDADVGISSHFDNPETRFAFRTRMLDYLWCGLPIVATRGDVFADDIKTHRLGLVVDYESVGDWYAALKKMNDNAGFRMNCKQSIAIFSRTLTWPAVMHKFTKNMQRGLVAADREVIRKYASKKSIRLGLGYKLRLAYAEGGWRRIRDLVIRKLISLRNLI